MNKINTIERYRFALITVLVAAAFGGATMGCVPVGNTALARFDTAKYTPNTNSTGLAGTWIFTLNNEFTQKIPGGRGLYQRDLVRIKPVDGAPDVYEFTYCDATKSLTRITVVASGNTVTLPVNGGADDEVADYSVTSNGRMTAVGVIGGYTSKLRAVRISGNPDLSAGTVGFDLSNDNAGVIKQPTTCFNEANGVVAGGLVRSYQLHAIAEGSAGDITVWLDDSPLNNQLFGTDGVKQVAGPIANLNALTLDAHGVRGSVAARADNGNPAVAGSLVLDVKF